MLILVGRDQRSFSLHINITKVTISIAQWVNNFSMIIIYFRIAIAYYILIALQY